MSAPGDDTTEQSNEQPPEGPGNRLKVARRAAGLDVDQVAHQLHLKPAQVEALEQDRYDDFPARVFVRGYLGKYARLVNLPADGVLEAFDAAFPDPEQASRLKRVGTHRPQVNSGHGVVRIVSWAVALGLVALFFVWWAGYLELNGGDDSMPPVAGPVPHMQPLVTGSATLPLSSPEPERSPAQDDEAPQPEPEAPELAPEPVAPEPEPETAPAMPETEPVAAPVPSEEPPSIPTPVVAEDEPPAAPSLPRPVVVLTLDDACWVQIRDASGTFKLVGELPAGTRRVLAGEPPYQVVLGKAAVAHLTVDGEALDLTPYTRGQVARFTFDPAAQ